MEQYYVALIRMSSGKLHPFVTTSMSALEHDIKTGSFETPKAKGVGIAVVYAESYDDSSIAIERYDFLDVQQKKWHEKLVRGQIVVRQWPDSFKGIWKPPSSNQA